MPYHDQAGLRGVVCDCLGLARGVWRDVAGADPQAIPPYSGDRGETGLRENLADGAPAMIIKIPLGENGPGALVLFRTAPRAIAKHVGNLTAGDRFIHAYVRLGVIEEALTKTSRRRIAFAFRFSATSRFTGKP